MKRSIPFVLVAAFLLAAPAAEAGFFSSIAKIFSQIPIIGNAVDHYGDKAAHKKVESKIQKLYGLAQKCSPLESDGNYTVHDLMKIKPGYPGWQTLEKFESRAKAAQSRANEKSGNDKIRHCYAGCFIRRDIGYSSAVLAAFSKELQDASDCSPATHFEMQDYNATVAGAIAGNTVVCDAFCGRKDVASMTGSEMLYAARNLHIVINPKTPILSKTKYRLREK